MNRCFVAFPFHCIFVRLFAFRNLIHVYIQKNTKDDIEADGAKNEFQSNDMEWKTVFNVMENNKTHKKGDFVKQRTNNLQRTILGDEKKRYDVNLFITKDTEEEY